MPAFSLAVSRGPTTPSPKARYSVFLPPFGGRARSLPVSLAAFLGAAPTLIWPGSHTRWRYKGGYYPPRGAQTSRPQVAMGTALPAFFVSTIFPFGRGGPLGPTIWWRSSPSIRSMVKSACGCVADMTLHRVCSMVSRAGRCTHPGAVITYSNTSKSSDTWRFPARRALTITSIRSWWERPARIRLAAFLPV